MQDSIKIWNGYIVDGHNRYEICRKHDLRFRTEEKRFGSIDQAKVWMIDHALDQRNLPTYAKADLIAEKEMILFTPKHGNRYTALSNQEEMERCKEISRAVPIGTQVNSDKSGCPTRKAAKAAGIGHNTYNKVKYLKRFSLKEVPPKRNSYWVGGV